MMNTVPSVVSEKKVRVIGDLILDKYKKTRYLKVEAIEILESDG